MSSELDDLKRQLAELKEQIAAKEKAEELPAYMSHIKRPEEPPAKPKMQKYDPTEGFRLPGSAAKAMAAVVPDPKPLAGFNAHSWNQNKGPGEPGGFGPPPKPTVGVGEVKRGSGWVDPQRLDQPSGIKYIDQQIDVQDAIDKAELERRLGSK
jgi:hypothetical protein